MEYEKYEKPKKLKTSPYSEYEYGKNSAQEFPNGYGFPAPKYVDPEMDYAIIKMGDMFIVARSKRLGSLDYDVFCTCETRHDAYEIVKALNK